MSENENLECCNGIEEKPQFKHDCSRCIFLGRYIENDVRHCDMYYCKTKLGVSVIARYSDEGANYASMPSYMATTSISHPGLVEAAKLFNELDLT